MMRPARCIAVACVGLMSVAASGGDDKYATIHGWDIFKNVEDCSAVASFDDGEVLGFSYDAEEKGTIIFFTYKEGTSLKVGDKKNIDIVLGMPNNRIDDGWENIEFHVAASDDHLLGSTQLNPPALSDFRRANAILFRYNGQKIGSYELEGTALALAELERCSQRMHGINPNDAFAR